MLQQQVRSTSKFDLKRLRSTPKRHYGKHRSANGFLQYRKHWLDLQCIFFLNRRRIILEASFFINVAWALRSHALWSWLGRRKRRQPPFRRPLLQSFRTTHCPPSLSLFPSSLSFVTQYNNYPTRFFFCFLYVFHGSLWRYRPFLSAIRGRLALLIIDGGATRAEGRPRLQREGRPITRRLEQRCSGSPDPRSKNGEDFDDVHRSTAFLLISNFVETNCTISSKRRRINGLDMTVRQHGTCGLTHWEDEERETGA